MSAFLWVGDFEYGDHGDIAHAIFGKALGFGREKFPPNLSALRGLLKENGVILATSYAEALALIDSQLLDFDFVVLDIDLVLTGEESEDARPMIVPELTQWYEYDPNALNEEQSYALARDKMKPVAGYHLWTHLVIDKGFPKDRVQFCSRHGEHLESITKSFHPAKIAAPEIFRKDDGRIGGWVAESSRKQYIWLRRNIINYCAALASHLRSISSDRRSFLRLSQFPGESTQAFTLDLARAMIKDLPLYLPENVPDKNVPQILHAFVRAMTMQWDRFNANQCCREEFKKREGREYKKAFREGFRAGASVLKLARNTVSHPSGSSIEFDCVDVALLFVLNKNVIFNLEGISVQSAFESRLLRLEDRDPEFNFDDLRSSIQRSRKTIGSWAKAAGLGNHEGVGDCLRELQKDSSPEYHRDAATWMFRMLWHELMWNSASADRAKFEQQVRNIGMAQNAVYRVAKACLGKAFPDIYRRGFPRGA